MSYSHGAIDVRLRLEALWGEASVRITVIDEGEGANRKRRGGGVIQVHMVVGDLVSSALLWTCRDTRTRRRERLKREG